MNNGNRNRDLLVNIPLNLRDAMTIERCASIAHRAPAPTLLRWLAGATAATLLAAFTQASHCKDEKLTFLEEAIAVRQTERGPRIDLSDVATRHFPLGEDAEMVRQRLRENQFQVWKKDDYKGQRFVGASYKKSIGALQYDEYRVWIDLDDSGHSKRARAWVFFHSL